jgi:hypothetical protein
MHSQHAFDAAREVADFFKLKVKIRNDENPDKAFGLLTPFLHMLLNGESMDIAAQILWTPNQFTPHPASVQQVWALFDEADTGLICGAASMGKSFSLGVRLFLEWVRDPGFTSIRVLGPTEDHLEENLFSHLVGLHTESALPMPGEVGELFIGLDRRNQISSIRGVVVPKGNTKKSGRLQGGHRKPRPAEHPVFGPLSRMFIFIDEIENIPGGIWKDVDNLMSNITEKGAQGFKVFGAYNPENPHSESKHFRWKSKRGWEVLRLDAERCENVVQKRVVYPGLQTLAGLEKIAANAGGKDSPGYMTMARGCYPRVGLEATVIPSGMLPKWRGEVIWLEDPQPCGAVDLALEGGDDAVFALGAFGKATGVKTPPNLEFPNGKTTMFKDTLGNVVPRWAVQVKQIFVLPKGDTVKMKDSVLTTCRRAGIKPEFFACDRTGHGAGVADLLKNEWSSIIHDVNYSESPTGDRLMAEDTKTCAEQYVMMCSELWFGLRQWGEFGYYWLHPGLDFSKIAPQLTQRRFRMQAGKTRVEAKKDYESRGFSSPNEADALTLLAFAVRRGSGLVLSMRGSSVDLPGGVDFGEDWVTSQYPGGARIDESNRSDFLDYSMVRPGEMAIL